MVAALTPPDDVRSDEINLRLPIVLGDGSMRYEGVAATTEPMTYRWGIERATVEALKDDAYHDMIRGLPIIMDRNAHYTDVRSDIAPEDMKDLRVGTITDSRFDDVAEEHILEVTIWDPGANEAIRIRGHKGMSLRYRAVVDDDGNQTKRHRINHLYIGPNTRGGARTQIRTDAEGDNMDEKLDALAEQVGGLLELFAKLEADVMAAKDESAAARSELAAMRDEAKAAEEARAAAEAAEAEAEGETKMPVRVADVMEAYKVATDLGLEFADDISLHDLQVMIAKAVQGDERADAMDDVALATAVSVAAKLYTKRTGKSGLHTGTKPPTDRSDANEGDFPSFLSAAS